MDEKKKTLYEILGVSPVATVEQLKAAHRRQSLAVMSAEVGVSREEIEHRLQVLDVALSTLLDANSRSLYDRKLAESEQRERQLALMPIAPGADSARQAEQVGNAIISAARHQTVSPPPVFQVELVVRSLGASHRTLALILRLTILVLLLGITIRYATNVMAFRKMSVASLPASVIARAEEMLAIQDYFKRTGVRVGSRAEVEELDANARQLDNDRREAEFRERKWQDESERFAEEARRRAEWQEMEDQRAEAEARHEAARRERQAKQPVRDEE